MKRNSILVLLSAMLGLVACQSNDFLNGKAQDSDQVRLDGELTFNKEITLKNGESTVFIRISSNYQDSIKIFLERTNMELVVNRGNEKFFDFNSERDIKQNTDELENKLKPDLTYEPSVFVESIGVNLEPSALSYGVRFSPNLLKTVFYGPHPGWAWSTQGRFIGVTSESTDGCPFAVVYHSQATLLSGREYITYKVLETYPDNVYLYTDYDTYKLYAYIYTNGESVLDPVWTFYTVVRYFQRRGTNCVIGTYVEPNCYIGTAPYGTTAFIHNGKFMYTPVDGDQCPLEGSHFDNVNCMVAYVPVGTYPSVWNNKWFIEPYLRYDLIGKVE